MEELNRAISLALSFVIAAAFLAVGAVVLNAVNDDVKEISSLTSSVVESLPQSQSPEPTTPIVEEVEEEAQIEILSESPSSGFYIVMLILLIFLLFVGVYHLFDLDMTDWFDWMSAFFIRVRGTTKSKVSTRLNSDYRTPPKTTNTFGAFLERGSADFIKQE